MGESRQFEQSPPANAFGKKQHAQAADSEHRRDQSDITSAYQGMKEDMSVLSSAEKHQNESPRRNHRHPPSDLKVTYESAKDHVVRQ